MNKTAFKSFIFALITGLLAGLSTPLLADDTDIYLGSKNLGGTTVRPNILFILDSSGSMAATVPGTGLSRLDNMKNAVKGLLDSINNVNVGLMDFTDPGGPVLFPVSDIEADADVIEGTAAAAGGSTPAFDVEAHVPLNSSDDGMEFIQSDSGSNIHTIDLGSRTLTMDQANAVVPPPGSGTPTTVLLQVGDPTPVGDPPQPGNSRDDAFQKPDGSVDTSNSDLKFKNGYTNGVRFENIAVPGGAQITSAFLLFKASKDKTGSVDLTIRGEASNSASQFNPSNNNLSSRPKTAAAVTWSVPGFTEDQIYASPNLKTVVQEIVNRGGWSSGTSDMAFLITHNGGSNERKAFTWDDDPNNAPYLAITYLDTTGLPNGFGKDKHIAGLRFTDINIPQGVTITSADIQFTAAQDNADEPLNDFQYKITAQKIGDAPTLSGSPNTNISDRALLANATTSVTWNPGAWTKDQKYTTPDLSAIIKELVAQIDPVDPTKDWCGGNAIEITIAPDLDLPTADGERVAYSSKSSGGATSGSSPAGTNPDAPVLHVNYDHNTVPATPGGCRVQTVQRQITTGSNDALEVNGTTMYVTYPRAYFYPPYKEGFRFDNLAIPQGATILGASLVMTTLFDSVGTPTLIWNGEAIDDSPGFSGASGDITRRALTTATVTETPPFWPAETTQISADLTPIVQEITSRGGWAQGNALSIIESTSASGFAYDTIYSFDGDAAKGATLKVKYRTFGTTTTAVKTVRKRLKEIVDTIPAYNWTPIVSTLFEAAQYYRGGPVIHGKGLSHLGFVQPYTQISTPASFTGGTPTPAGCTPGMGINVSNPCSGISGSPIYTSPMSGAQCQANYIVLLTDGEANHNAFEQGTDHGVSLIKSMMGNPNCTASTSGEACGRDLVKFLHTQDQNAALPGNQTVDTYTIGFNTQGLATATQFLKDLGDEGGGQGGNHFFEAQTAGDLAAVFQSIFINILNKPTSSAAPSLSVNAFNRLYSRNDVYFSLFKPSKSAYWNGNVKKYKICDGISAGLTSCSVGDIMDANNAPAVDANNRIKDTALSLWSSVVDGTDILKGGMGEFVPGHVSRVIYSYTGATAPSNVDLTAASNAVLDNNTSLTKALLGDAAMTNQQRTDLIDWIRGQDVDDLDKDGLTTDDRYAMDDPLHASPITITYGGTEAAPVIKLFVNTNAGTMRMVNASTGEEEWSFIPQELLAKQKDLRANANGGHIYGLDLTPTVWSNDTNSDGIIDPAQGDFVRLIFGMRRGGRNIYAVDVTPTSILSNPTSTGGIDPRLMWRISGGSTDFPSLGETWSRPVLTKVFMKSTGTNLVAKQVIIFAGGNDNLLDNQFGTTAGVGGNQGNAIYVADPTDGSLILSIGNSGSGADVQVPGFDYPVTTKITAIDSNGDGATDRLYFGDLGGNVWRVDLAGLIAVHQPGDIIVGKLADISLSDGAVPGSQTAVTRRFYHGADVVQVVDAAFSDEARFDYVVLTSGSRPTPLKQVVHDRVYAFRDFSVDGLTDGNGDHLADTGTYPTLTNNVCTSGTPSSPCLYDATANRLQLKNNGSPLDPAAFTVDLPKIKASSGWFIDLREQSSGQFIGEKGLARPITLAGKLFFTTFTPTPPSASDPCQLNEGQARAWGVNILNASALFADWNPSGGSNPTRGDRFQVIGGGIPSEPQVLIQKEGITLEVGIAGGIATIDPKLGLPRYKTYWYQQMQ